MSRPRNNLEDILKKHKQAAATAPTSFARSQSQSQSQDGAPKPKFRVAGRPSPSNVAPAKTPAALQKSPSYTSFSTPGFGKKKPTSTFISSNPTAAISNSKPHVADQQAQDEIAAGPSKAVAQAVGSLPTKRQSPFTAPPPKRPRPSVGTISDKENVDAELVELASESTQEDESDVSIVMMSHRDKGKERERPYSLAPPPPSQRNIDHSRLSTPSKLSGSSVRPSGYAPALYSTTASTSTRTSVTADSRASCTQWSSTARQETASEDTNDHARRNLSLDYSDVLTMSTSDLIDVKAQIVDVRSDLVTLRCSKHGHAAVILSQLEEIVRDRLSCIDAALNARQSGQDSIVLPTPTWSFRPPVPVAAPSKQAPLCSKATAEPSFQPPPDDYYDALYDPSFDPAFDNFAQESVDYGPIDVDVDGFDGDKSNDPESPHIEIPDSDDALWGQVDGFEPSFEPDIVPVSRPSEVQDVPGPSRLAVAPPDRPATNQELTKTPFYSDLLRTLTKVFGLQSFRHNQLEVCTASMQGHDIFVLMPTGGGKSLCFQLPAVLKNTTMGGVTVVISPLVALMHDQVCALRDKGVKVAGFFGEQTAEEANNVHRMLRTAGHRPALLYATPEKLDKSERLKSDLMTLYEAGLLVRLVADEAHCIPTWGRNFRDSYRDFTWIRDKYPNVPVIALTATANSQGIQDIITRLRMRNCVQYTASFNRPNLHYEVRHRGSEKAMTAEITAMLQQKYRGKTGIIYCPSREKCERLANSLRSSGITAEHYHAQVVGSEKERVQQQWQAGRTKVIVATIAFGMGIDKPDVRFVIHTAIPNSLSDYYQETGRAGRDGEPSDCILYYHWPDASWKIKRAREEARENNRPDHAEHASDLVGRVVQYCLNNVDCRRKQVLAYFDEQFDPKDCHDLCDNCKDKTPIKIVDVTQYAVDFVKLTQQAQQQGLRAARGTLIKAFIGKMDAHTRNKGFEELEAFGAGSVAAKANKDLPERLHDTLVARTILITASELNRGSGYSQDYTQAGRNATKFLQKPVTITIGFRESGKGSRLAKSKAAAQAEPASVPSSKPGRRARKAAEIPWDPIDDFDDDFVPEEANEAPAAEPVAGTSRNTRQTTVTRPPAAVCMDDDIEILDEQPSIAQTKEGVVDPCLKALIEFRDEIGLAVNEDVIDLVEDGALQMLSLVLPSDVREVEQELEEFGVDVAALRDIPELLPGITEICLNHKLGVQRKNKQSKQKPSSKKGLGTRSKPPSIAQLHDNYDYPASTSKPSSKRK